MFDMVMIKLDWFLGFAVHIGRHVFLGGFVSDRLYMLAHDAACFVTR